jgi:hypothetical protein
LLGVVVLVPGLGLLVAAVEGAEEAEEVAAERNVL